MVLISDMYVEEVWVTNNCSACSGYRTELLEDRISRRDAMGSTLMSGSWFVYLMGYGDGLAAVGSRRHSCS